jgi:alanyl-tRNA synthetase
VRLSLPGYSQDELREISDRIKANLKMAVVFLASARDNKASYVLSATEDAVKNGIHSGALLKEVLKGCDGSGGGRSHLAQGGGTDPDKISKAFERLKKILEGKKT